MVALTNLLDLAWSAVLVPVWAMENGGGAAVGRRAVRDVRRRLRARLALAAASADRLPRYATYLVCFLVTGCPGSWSWPSDTPLWGVLAFCVVGGFASGFLNPILGAVIYERIPEPPDGPGHLAVDRVLLRADAARRPGRRLPGRRRRAERGAAGLRGGLLRGDDAPGRRPALARDRPAPGARPGAGSRRR